MKRHTALLSELYTQILTSLRANLSMLALLGTTSASTQTFSLQIFEEMLATLRPSVAAGAPLRKLPAALLDSLEHWASDCTEPGFIAKEILRRNGRIAISECEGEAEERAMSEQSKTSNSGDSIRLYPNPSQGHIFIELPKHIHFAEMTLFALDGRALLRQMLTNSTLVKLSGLPQGMYLCRFVDEAGIRSVSKLILSR